MQNLLKFRRFLSTCGNTIGKHKYEQIVCVETEIYSPSINNNIYYRGFSVYDLAFRRRFLETFYLLLNSELPTKTQNAEFASRILRGMNQVPHVIRNLNRVLPRNLHVCDFLTSSWSLMNSESQGKCDSDYSYIFGQCLGLLSLRYLGDVKYDSFPDDPVLPLLVSLLLNRDFLKIEEPIVSLMNSIFTIYLDHGLTSASYNCRVCISEGGSTLSGLVCAASTHKYSLDTLDFYLTLKGLSKEELESILVDFESHGTLRFPLDELTSSRRDPRCRILTAICKDHFGEDLFSWISQIESRLSKRFHFRFEVYVFDIIRRLYHSHNNLGRGTPLSDLQSPSNFSDQKIKDRITAALTVSRIAGWLSHVSEQRRIGRRIEHLAAYIGSPPKRRLI